MPTVYIPESSKVVHKTSVDFIKRPNKEPIHIVQYDKTIPIMEVRLYLNDIPYAISENMEVWIRWRKPDKTVVYKDILGCSTDRKIIYFEIDGQMSYHSGIIYPIIELRIADGGSIPQTAGSAPIPVIIDPNPILDIDIESQSEYFDINPYIGIEQIRESFILSLKKSYKEIYKNVEGRVYLVDVWEDNLKLNHIFTKSFTYDLQGRVTSIETVDHIRGNILLKTLNYISDTVLGIEETFTEVST